ncbi:MAG: hypothetical protein NW208_01380 [Bryobacter sp.]|nr:hypothetical protein [Bryobacter sp.]
MRSLLLLLSLALFAQDPKEILAKALDRDQNNTELLNTYSYQKYSVVEYLEKNGAVKRRQTRLEDVFYVDGTEIERLLEKDGKPLSEKEQAEEQKKVDKAIAKIKNESPGERAKRRGEREKDKREEAEARREVLDAYDLKLAGTEEQLGYQCWRIEGTPRAGWKGKGRRAKQIQALEGKLWVDQGTNEWIRMELRSIDTLSFGWFLFRLQKGAEVEITQAQINNEVWLPQTVHIRADARVLGKMMRINLRQTYKNFKKFSAESQLILSDASEAPPN